MSGCTECDAVESAVKTIVFQSGGTSRSRPHPRRSSGYNRRMRASLAVIAALAGCSDDPERGEMVELPSAPDVVASIAFDGAGTPMIAAGDRLYARDGDAWSPVPLDGIPGLAPPLRVAILDDDATFVLDAEGAMYRRAGAAWEAFNDDATLASTTPVTAADGTLYALGLPTAGTGGAPLRLRTAGDAAWRDSGTEVPVGCVPVPDPTSGVWCDRNDANGSRDGGLIHVDGTSSDELDLAWGAAPALGDTIGLVGSDGALVGASFGLAPHHGEVIAVNPRTGERSHRTAGGCEPNETNFGCGDDPTPGAIIYATLLAPGGELYELYARRDGDAPALLQLGDERWFVVVPELDGNRFNLTADRGGTVHAFSGTRILRLSR
jgi:hypothetical protein